MDLDQISTEGRTGSALKAAPLETLARMVGLASTVPLEKLMSSSRGRARLESYFAGLTPPVIAAGSQPRTLATLPKEKIDRLAAALGLAWCLARQRAVLGPQEVLELRTRFESEVLELADIGLQRLAVPAALMLPKGLDWLNVDECGAFGRRILQAYENEAVPGAGAKSISEAVPRDARNRVAELDCMIDAVLRAA